MGVVVDSKRMTSLDRESGLSRPRSYLLSKGLLAILSLPCPVTMLPHFTLTFLPP